jgi:cobalt-zinc-cadmium efflux system protein
MSSDEHAGHDHGDLAGARLRWALALTTAFMVLEVLAGLWSGSLALLADAGHMLTDSASLALALFAVVVSRRPADERRTYGYGRVRVLAAFINGLSLLAIATWIVIEAVMRLNEPREILAGPMLGVAVAGLVVNLVVLLILRGGTDINTRGAMAHVFGDLLGSVAAIAAAAIILTTGWTPADPLLSIAVAALIVRTGVHVTRESGHALLEGTPPEFDATQVERSLLDAIPEIHGVHHVHAWTVGADDSYVTLHVCAYESLQPDSAVARVQTHLAERFGYHHVTVQVEYGACQDQAH